MRTVKWTVLWQRSLKSILWRMGPKTSKSIEGLTSIKKGRIQHAEMMLYFVKIGQTCRHRVFRLKHYNWTLNKFIAGKGMSGESGCQLILWQLVIWHDVGGKVLLWWKMVKMGLFTYCNRPSISFITVEMFLKCWEKKRSCLYSTWM